MIERSIPRLITLNSVLSGVASGLFESAATQHVDTYTFLAAAGGAASVAALMLTYAWLRLRR